MTSGKSTNCKNSKADGINRRDSHIEINASMILSVLTVTHFLTMVYDRLMKDS